MSQETRFASAGVAVVLGAAAVFFFMRKQPPAPPPRPAATARAEAQDRESERTSEAEATARAEARRARDAMKKDILAALRRRDAGATPPPVTPVRAGATRAATAAAEEEPPHGHYEASYIQEHFREDMFPLIKQCYESALKRQPDLAGKLVLKFGIVGDPAVGGIVEGADFADGTTLKDPEMEMCVRETVMTLTFDKPPTGGGYVTVTYPIAFSPGEEPPEEKTAPVPPAPTASAPSSSASAPAAAASAP